MAREIAPVISVVLLGAIIGAAAGVGAWWSLTGLHQSPPIWGIERRLAFGIPLAVIAATHGLSSVLLLITRSTWALALCVLSTLIVFGFFFAFEVSTIGFMGARLVSVLVYGIPAYMILEARKAYAAMGSQESFDFHQKRAASRDQQQS